MFVPGFTTTVSSGGLQGMYALSSTVIPASFRPTADNVWGIHSGWVNNSYLMGQHQIDTSGDISIYADALKSGYLSYSGAGYNGWFSFTTTWSV